MLFHFQEERKQALAIYVIFRANKPSIRQKQLTSLSSTSI